MSTFARELVTAPKVRAELNGMPINTILRVDITNTGSTTSSRFELMMSTVGEAALGQWIGRLRGIVSVKIYIRSQSGDMLMFQGLADSISTDPINQIIRIVGRDYSSVMIGSAYQASFCNQTASEIANYIAMRHGLDQNISTTSTMVGNYQFGSYNQVVLNAHSKITSEWGLLTQLANREGFELFVDGRTLVFAAWNSLQTDNASIGPGDVTGIAFYRNCPISDHTTVTVKSWIPWLNTALSHTNDMVSELSDVADMPTFATAEIAIVTPNLTSQAAERLGAHYVTNLNGGALTVQIRMPGELFLKPRDTISVAGFGVNVDSDFRVGEIRRSYSTTSGFIQRIQASLVTPAYA